LGREISGLREGLAVRGTDCEAFREKHPSTDVAPA
jgi:hypothetical protein